MPDEALAILSELEALLAPGNPYQAEVLRKLREAIEEADAKETVRQFQSLDMWGGSGSVADVSLGIPEADERMNALLVGLVRVFEDEGITFERASRWASVFEAWREEGVFKQKPQS